MPRFFIVCGALALAGCATTHAITPTVAAQGAFASPETVEVHLANFDFVPSTLHLQAGKAYRIDLVDDVPGGHNFTAPEFFAAARVAPEDAAELADGQVEVSDRATRSIRLIPTAGHFPITCTHLGHAALGMKGEVIVQ